MSLPSIPSGYYQIVFVILVFVFYNQYQADLKERSDSQLKYELAVTDYAMNSSPLVIDSFVKAHELNTVDLEEKRIAESLKTASSKFSIAELKSLSFKLDSLRTSYDATSLGLAKIRSKIDILKFNLDTSKLLKEEVGRKSYSAFYFLMIGCIIFVLYQIGKESAIISNTNKINHYKNRTYKYCQSCAKYFSPMLLHGKEKDGTENKGFCNECYNDGQFLNPELTELDVMANIVKANQIEVNAKKITSFLSTTKIKIKIDRMVRWNKNPYKDKYQF